MIITVTNKELNQENQINQLLIRTDEIKLRI